jgi:hypothetical protein
MDSCWAVFLPTKKKKRIVDPEIGYAVSSISKISAELVSSGRVVSFTLTNGVCCELIPVY